MNWKDIFRNFSMPVPFADKSYKYRGLIDIVIPVYNDRLGLQKTLFSLNIMDKYNIIVVDDCSTENYDDIIEMFSQYHNIKLFRTPQNGGPAVAKNYGLSKVANEYVICIDAGDTLTAANAIIQYEEIFVNNPRVKVISAAHYEECADSHLNYIPPQHNRWMGKAYKVDTIKRYGLQFNESCSFSNDDIGMNMLMRLALDDDEIFEWDFASIIWHIDMNSVTRKDNFAGSYKNSTLGTSSSAIYAIKRARETFCDENKVRKLIYSVMCGLYHEYLSVLNYRPEFADDALRGAKLFYDEGLMQCHIDFIALIDYYNITMYQRLNNDRCELSLIKIPNITFADFLQKLDDLEI